MAADGGTVKSLEEVVGGLRALSGDIESCAVISSGGKLVYSAHPEGVERERAQAMLAALAGISNRTARSGGRETVAQVRVKTESGHFLMVGLDDGGYVAATTGPEARIGLVLYDMRNARREISEAAKNEEG